MKALLWSFAERLAPRIGTALLMLGFAATSSPATVGYYAAVMTGYTILQALTDGAAKRISIPAVSTVNGQKFLYRYKIWYAALGSLFLLLVLLVVWWWGAPIQDIITLTPILILPSVMGATIFPLARLQRQGEWRHISIISGTSTLIALSVAFPLVLALHNALGSVMQLLITEAVFAFWLSRYAKSKCKPIELSEDVMNYRSAFWSTGALIISMQGQYQLDRILIGLWGGASKLGAFNLGWSLSRSVTDSLSTSTLSVLQAQTLDSRRKTNSEISALIMGVLPRALLMSSVVVFFVYLASRFIAPLFLNDDWNSMLQVVPLMSATALPSICCYCLLPALMYQKKMAWAITPRALGLVFSIGVGWAVQYSLETAVWFALVRELVSLLVMMIGARSVVTLRMIVLPVLATVLTCAGIVFADTLVL